MGDGGGDPTLLGMLNENVGRIAERTDQILREVSEIKEKHTAELAAHAVQIRINTENIERQETAIRILAQRPVGITGRRLWEVFIAICLAAASLVAVVAFVWHR